ncbi:MAG: nucleotidyltransferase family protein [Cyclobacteriaceae bacterium]|nr:nucleotidyltransferase family protein [Cyclobacteriaceae bacterium]
MGDERIIALILAAGSSSRMGKSKQLLHVDGQPLLRKTIETTLASHANSILVVLGDNSDSISKSISDMPVDCILNENWTEGIGSSLKSGVREIQKRYLNAEAILILVCDQPLLTADHLNELIRKYIGLKKLIIASGYTNTAGVPAIFDKALFHKLLALENHQGAKKIIEQLAESTVVVSFAEGAVDLDTPEDYSRYKTLHP